MRFNEAGKIRKLQQQVQKACEAALTDMLVTAQNHFTENFRKQGFDDRGVQAWQPRKRTERSRGGNRAILVGKGSGVLRRSIAKRKTGKYSGMIFIIGNANKYAKVHNDGLRSGRGKGFIMPKRQLIGDSYNMFQKIDRKVKQRLDRVFK
jgi:phage gpG-like protein